MKRTLLYASPVFLAIAVFLIVQFFILKNSGKGALQVTTNPVSAVYLNGKLIGNTPLCKCETQDMIPTGEYTVRLIPKDQSFQAFEEKIKISKSILTVVDRTFGTGAMSDGSIIDLSPLDDSKNIELLVLSFPDNAEILVDNSSSGKTPLLIKNLTESDHEIKFLKEGYKEKVVRIKTVAGYRLTAEVFLGINPVIVDLNPALSSPSADLENKTATTSGISKVTILQTPTGFLRVRDEPSLSGLEIAKVTPGDEFDLIDEKSGWFNIKLKDGRTGWINGQYARKQ